MPAAPNRSINQTQEFWSRHPNPYIRLLGRDVPASAVLAQAAGQSDAHFRLPPLPAGPRPEDYAQIDPTLPLARDDASVADPLPHTSYAGMNPVQRRRFANWLTTPEMAAPVAFRHLYLAWLESALFEEERRTEATAHIFSLLTAGGWRGESALAQTALLAGWLAPSGPLIAQAISQGHPPAWVLTVGAGWLAHLGEPLGAESALALARGWNLYGPALHSFNLEADGGLLQLRITSLANSLGADPLVWALAQIDASDPWLAWRTVHRDLRLLVPQIDLRPALEPRLRELFASLPVSAAPHRTAAGPAEEAGTETAPAPNEWYLILEFGSSRSQHYDYAIHLARKQAGYQLLMDETRQLIHRVRFRKRNMRQFWRLWAYVESWSSTRVYVDGKEMQKWNVFPYSAEMK
jgi:hypothetical protein